MTDIKILAEWDYDKKFIVLRDFFINELNFIADNGKKLHTLKQDATHSIEGIKLDLRQQCSPIKLFKADVKPENRVSVRKLQNILMLMDRDIGLIQNQFDVTHNDIINLKNILEKHLRQTEKAELVMNMLNYKMYELQYNFMKKVDEIKTRRKTIESSNKNESQIAVALINLDKEMSEFTTSHDVSFKVAKEHKLEAEEAYENVVGVLDDIIDIIKKHYNNLQMLLEAEKSFELTNDLHAMIVEEIEQTIEKYGKMQVDGWKSNVIKNVSDFARTLKLTPEGLLTTEDGRRISYGEVQSKRLLDFMEIFEHETNAHITDGSKPSMGDRQSTTSSSDDKMLSEDVSYLKEHLGTPLTLALAELTTVQPRDPVHYLGHWLFKYRYNQEIGELKKFELQELLDERRGIAEKKWHSFIESEARAAVIDMITRAEEEAIKNEYIRIAKELESEEYQENLEDEARDKFEEYE